MNVLCSANVSPNQHLKPDPPLNKICSWVRELFWLDAMLRLKWYTAEEYMCELQQHWISAWVNQALRAQTSSPLGLQISEWRRWSRLDSVLSMSVVYGWAGDWANHTVRWQWTERGCKGHNDFSLWSVLAMRLYTRSLTCSAGMHWEFLQIWLRAPETGSVAFWGFGPEVVCLTSLGKRKWYWAIRCPFHGSYVDVNFRQHLSGEVSCERHCCSLLEFFWLTRKTRNALEGSLFRPHLQFMCSTVQMSEEFPILCRYVFFKFSLSTRDSPKRSHIAWPISYPPYPPLKSSWSNLSSIDCLMAHSPPLTSHVWLFLGGWADTIDSETVN